LLLQRYRHHGQRLYVTSCTKWPKTMESDFASLVRIRIAVRPNGSRRAASQITAWLDENCGADGWAMTPSGTRGVLNDALSIYFADATLASAFVARWCVAAKAETAGGVFQVRADEPEPRVGAGLHDRCSPTSGR
jgi:hypothetical protein